MKKCIIMFLIVLFMLAGCQKVSEPSQTNQENSPGMPPLIISLQSIEELHQLKEIIKTRDEKKIQETLLAQGLRSEEEIINFLRVIDSLPILKIIDGEIIGITYQLGKIIEVDENGNYHETDQRQEIAYVTTQSADGSWIRLTYSLANRNLPIEEVLKTSDQKDSLLQKPFKSANDRCFVYHESREEHPTKEGDFVTWLAVIDGIPARIRYYTENAGAVKAETVFQNATIGALE